MNYNDMNGDTMQMNGQDMNNMKNGNMPSNMDMKQKRMKGNFGKMTGEQTQVAEEVYSTISEHMCKAICFHEQLADYFCFLGLQGFKRMLEYQYMKECADKRKLHRRYIDMHHKVIPVKQVQTPIFIPKDWNRYTTKDIDDSIVPKFVRAALSEYYDWEEKTKQCYEEQCAILKDMNMVSDYEFVKELILDVDKEIKKIHRIMENLNGTGYDVTAVHGMQDKYHEKYKKKYQDRFTTKNNYVPFDEIEPEYRRDRTRRKIGYN